MEKNKTNGQPAPGAEMPPVLTEEQFTKMVNNDLRSASGLLFAMESDPATKRAVTEFLYGRYLNQLHKADLSKQTKIDA